MLHVFEIELMRQQALSAGVCGIDDSDMHFRSR